MKREIQRRYTINSDDLREAVIDWLRKADAPIPSDDAMALTMCVSEGPPASLVMSWTETIGEG